MRYLMLLLLCFFLAACSVRMPDPPNYNQALCQPPASCSPNNGTTVPRIPLVQG